MAHAERIHMICFFILLLLIDHRLRRLHHFDHLPTGVADSFVFSRFFFFQIVLLFVVVLFLVVFSPSWSLSSSLSTSSSSSSSSSSSFQFYMFRCHLGVELKSVFSVRDVAGPSFSSGPSGHSSPIPNTWCYRGTPTPDAIVEPQHLMLSWPPTPDAMVEPQHLMLSWIPNTWCYRGTQHLMLSWNPNTNTLHWPPSQWGIQSTFLASPPLARKPLHLELMAELYKRLRKLIIITDPELIFQVVADAKTPQ